MGLRVQESNKNNVFCFNLFVRKKATTKAGITPVLTLFDTQHWKRPEERKQAAMKELKEKKAILEQRRKYVDFYYKSHMINTLLTVLLHDILTMKLHW